jgi:hypothetical protein
MKVTSRRFTTVASWDLAFRFDRTVSPNSPAPSWFHDDDGLAAYP